MPKGQETVVRGAWVLSMGPEGAIRDGAVGFDAKGEIRQVGGFEEVSAAMPVALRAAKSAVSRAAS